jgi:Family of unknown function (DUF6141)
MSIIIYREVQKFRQWWIMMILLLSLGIWLWGIVQQLVYKIPFGNHPITDLGLILIGIIVLIPVLVFLWIKMITEIRTDGLYYKMYPLMGFKKIAASEIKDWEVKEYSPLKEFGGWGIRFSAKKGGGKAINVKGKHGLQLELNSGKKILIGSQDPEKIKAAMQKLLSSK